jgi:hypothetical protein
VWAGDFDTVGLSSLANPEDVGRSGLSDINISAIFRTDVRWSGLSGGGSDKLLAYTGGAGDIFLNTAKYNYSDLIDFDEYSKINQTLMHEILHGLGMSHPFKYVSGIRTVTTDFSALLDSGFQNLGFQLSKPSDVNKEYFTIMSYDDQPSLDGTFFEPQNAFTPMIFDVLALQEIYGEGQGTSGFGNDVIEAGTIGYRTYFDKGGIDTIDLKYYETGGYVDLGESIGGSKYEVGIVLNLTEADRLWNGSGNPQHLRWLYGNIENVSGSAYNDLIIDSDANNYLFGGSGDDTFIMGRKGNDTVDGGVGFDRIAYFHNLDQYSIIASGTQVIVSSSNAYDYGTDTVLNIEYFDFNDAKNVTLARILSIIKTDFRDVTALQDSSGHFLFTGNATEAEIMQQFGWKQAAGLKAFETVDHPTGVTLHKFYYPPTNSFYYATDDQAKAVKAAFTGWVYQGATDMKVYTEAQLKSGVAPKESVPIYQMWVNGTGHVYTTDTKLVDTLMGQDINTDLLTANNVATSKGTYNGVVFWGDPAGNNATGSLSPFSTSTTDYRDAVALQDKDGHFLFTANKTESEIMQQYGWTVATGLKPFESVDNANGVTLHKFYYPPTNSFYYATDDQAKAVKAAFTGWDYQGATDQKVYTNAQFGAGTAPSGSVPIYQMWINGKGHVYTSDTALVDRLMGQDINTNILTANNVVTAVGTYNGVVFWGDPTG